MLKRAQCTTQLPVAVVLAKSELESWFLGAKESLRGVRGIREDAISPLNPEDIRGAKEHLSGNMRGNRIYNVVDDQPAFAEKFNIQDARARCQSLEKLVKSFWWLVKQIIP